MKTYQQLLLYLVIFTTVISKDEINKTFSESKNNTNKSYSNTSQNSTSKNSRHQTNLNITEFNLTTDEKDKLMFCSYFVDTTLKHNKGPIRGLANKTNISYGMAFEKVGSDIFEYCNKKMPMKTVNKYLKNLTYSGGFKLTNEYAEYVEIDYDKYKNKSDFELSENQELLNAKYKKTQEIFIIMQMEKRKKFIDSLNKTKNKENTKIIEDNAKLRKYPINTIIFLMIFALLIIIAVFLLGSLINKRKKDKKDKKDKKEKTQ